MLLTKNSQWIVCVFSQTKSDKSDLHLCINSHLLTFIWILIQGSAGQSGKLIFSYILYKCFGYGGRRSLSDLCTQNQKL